MRDLKIAINGMGRIGRLLFRRLFAHTGIEIVAVNDLMPGENLAYLLRHDSIYGNASRVVRFGNALVVDDQTIACYNQPDPAQLPWRDLDVDVVLECTGNFTTQAGAQKHIDAGARKVLLSTTGSNEVPLMIFGHGERTASLGLNIIAPGGCMTNCSTHVLKIMEGIGFDSVHINVIHSYTSRQELVDGPNKDFRRGRAAALSIVPVAVDLADALIRLFPSLDGKLSATTTRVPVANGALADFTFHLTRTCTVEEVNARFREAAAGALSGIVEYTEEQIVSQDVTGNVHSAVVDGSLTSMAGKQLKLMAFFDNEFGFTSRMIDWLEFWRHSR